MAVLHVRWRVLRIQIAKELKLKPREVDEMARDYPQDIQDFIAVTNAESLSQKMKVEAAQRQAKARGKGRRS